MRAGVGISMLTGDVRKVLNRIASIAQDHYPETMAQTIIINAPMSFRMVWGVVKPMLQPRTVNKITLLGTKYLDELLQRVDKAMLPSYMGGECGATLLEDPGPWNDDGGAVTLRGIQEMPSADDAPSRGHARLPSTSTGMSQQISAQLSQQFSQQLSQQLSGDAKGGRGSEDGGAAVRPVRCSGPMQCSATWH
jgi:CRAL/TRIO domain